MHRIWSALSIALILPNIRALNNRPIIGIFSLDSVSPNPKCGGKCEYVAASYVKWLESAGARSVPVPYHATDTKIDDLFDSVNGLLFTGGVSSITDSAKYFYKKIIDANENGDYFPVWGTCQGFQWLLELVSENDDILDSGFNSENYSIALDVTDKASDSRIFGHDSKLLNILKTENVTMNNHHSGLTPKHFTANDKLVAMFDIISNNVDRDGTPFVSTMEAKKLPIYGVQWHPEKNNFEWAETADGSPYEAINHTADAITISQAMANFFVNEARKNDHKFQTPELEKKALFYNYPVTKTFPDFVQTYFMHL